MSLPGVQVPPPFAVPTIPACITSCCFVIGNMFDPSKLVLCNIFFLSNSFNCKPKNDKEFTLKIF